MIRFKKLTYKNFLSTGNNPTEINLDACPTTLIVGRNGGGKSTMIDALSFALFDKPHRLINKNQLINSINNKDCLVTVEFEIDADKYKIVRGRKPNKFEIYVNGSMINIDSSTRDYQKLLETNILKLNHKSFHQVVVLGSSNFIPFMQLPAYHRRNVIEDLLDISIFSKMNNLLKEISSKQKENIKDSENEINLISEKIRIHSKHIQSLSALGEKNNAKINEEIAILQADIAKLELENEKLNGQYEKEYAIAKLSLDKKQGEVNKLISLEHTIKDNIKTNLNESKFYSENDVCSSCKQTISKEIKESHIHSCKEKDERLNKGYAEIKDAIQSSRQKLNETLTIVNGLTKIPNVVSSNNSIIASNNRRVNSLLKQLNSSINSSDIEKAKTQLDKLKENHKAVSENRLSQIEDKAYSDVITELLKDTGIKTKIIKQYLPVMNNLINHYLQILDFFVSFHLDESFSETIKSRHRDDFSYASFSEGEKARINLALLFAWRQIAKMKNSANTNLLILDEVLDSSVDGEGIECFMQILSTLDKDTRTFIISHKQEYSENKFDRCLKFGKVNNFSQLLSD